MEVERSATPAFVMPPALRGLRVLGACDNYTADSSGGAEKAAHEIYRRLGAAGGDLRVLSVPHGPPYDDEGVRVVVARGLDLSRLVGGYLGVSPETFVLAGRERRSFEPQALHANTIHYNASIALARLAARHRLPLVLTAQVGPMNELPFTTRMSAGAYERTVGRYIVKRSTRVLAVSETVRAHMIDLGADPERVTVVENGVDHDRFASAPLGVSADPLVLSVGRLVDNKGPQLLVEAAVLLAARGRCPRICFLGDGPLRDGLERRVADAGIADRVRFEGQVRDVERWMAEGDIVVRPSFTEGLPLAVLEAMSAGRCNIVSDIPPNRELIEDGANGLTFLAGDAAHLADRLALAVGDGPLRLRLAAAGREASLGRSWDRMAVETAEVLVAVAATGEVGRA